MHLLRTQPGSQLPVDSIADLGQTPAELVILCTGDSQLSLLAEVARQLPADYPSLRLASPAQLSNHASVDLYVEQVLQHAKVILISVHGGVSYWRYGIERLVELAERGAQVIMVPGCDNPDPELMALSSVPLAEAERLWQFLRQGGAANAQQLFNCIASHWLQRDYPWVEPQPLPRVGLYHPQLSTPSLSDWQAHWQVGAPVAALLFYRTQVQAANTGFIDVFCQRLQAQGLNPLPIAVASLKEVACLAQVEDWLDEANARLIINTTAFALSNPEAPSARPFCRDIPVLQAICALDNHEQWQANAQGLGSRDLAMHIVLPELDGRLITQPISFKGLAWRSERSQSDVVCYQPHLPGMDFVAELARNWIELARKHNADKRIALVLANYPTRDGRIGNGVGLDTPAAALNILKALQQQGYPVAGLPDSGTALIHQLLGGVTNELDSLDARPCAQSLALDEYLAFFHSLPVANQQAVRERWGEPQQDPMFRSGRLMIAGLRFGLTFVGIQPARGYQLDAAAVYHDPDLVPRHGYLAFYCWLRRAFACDAVIHVAGAINAADRAGFAACNIDGTAAMIEAAKAAGIARFIHVSSLAAREPALSDYGWSKAQSEHKVEISGLDWTIIRPPAVYGPGDREMLELFRMAARGIVLLPPAGRLSLIAVDDLCTLLMACALGDDPGILRKTYEPDDAHPRGLSHTEFARLLGTAVGRSVMPLSVPALFLSLASWIERLVKRDAAKLTADRVRYFCHPDWVSRAALAPPVRLWRPQISAPEGLAATAVAYRAVGWL